MSSPMGLPALDKIIIHCSVTLPSGAATDCHPAIVTGGDDEHIFVTVMQPNQAPRQAILGRKSLNWHFASDCENLWF